MKTLIKNIFNPARSIKVKEFLLASCILSPASLFLVSFILFPGAALSQTPAQLEALQSELEALSIRTERLQDVEEIEILQRSYAGLTEMWDAGHLKPQQSHAFSLADTSEAIKALRDRKAMGKVIIKVRDGE